MSDSGQSTEPSMPGGLARGRGGRDRFRAAQLLLLLPPLLGAWIAMGTWPGARLIPFAPHPEDLEVYLHAAHFLLAGEDFYLNKVSFPYIYPPIAAVLAVPLAWLPLYPAKLVWGGFNALILLAAVNRLGVRGWWGSLLTAVTIAVVAPFSSTFGLGQLGVLMLALVVFDLTGDDRRRRVPAGVWLGLATGLKLTPGVFIVLCLLTGRVRQGLVAAATFLGTLAVGFLVAPHAAWGFWSRLAHGDSGANPDAAGWMINLSVQSATQRFLGVEAGATWGLLLSGVLVVLGLWAATRCWRHEQPMMAIGVLGMCSSLANPIAWQHHLTWILALALAVVTRVEHPRRLGWGVRGLALAVVAWSMFQPQWSLGGAPWAHREIFEYSLAQKWFSAGLDVLVAVLALWVAVRASRMCEDPVTAPGSDADPANSAPHRGGVLRAFGPAPTMRT